VVTGEQSWSSAAQQRTETDRRQIGHNDHIGSQQLYKLTNHCTMHANEVTSTLEGEVYFSSAIVDTQAMIPSQPSGHGRRTDRPIAVVVDLCLYRVVTDRCRGHVLPFGVRQMIKDYAWVSFDNETLRAAVRLWCSDRATAYHRYGDINDWEVPI
jgi:hypothetical protein